MCAQSDHVRSIGCPCVHVCMEVAAPCGCGLGQVGGGGSTSFEAVWSMGCGFYVDLVGWRL